VKGHVIFSYLSYPLFCQITIDTIIWSIDLISIIRYLLSRSDWSDIGVFVVTNTPFYYNKCVTFNDNKYKVFIDVNVTFVFPLSNNSMWNLLFRCLTNQCDMSHAIKHCIYSSCRICNSVSVSGKKKERIKERIKELCPLPFPLPLLLSQHFSFPTLLSPFCIY
jgi:hypothetical protein